MWGNCDGKLVTEHRFGKGRVISGKTAREVLAADGVVPDFSYGGDPQKTFLDYIHRVTNEADIYFIANHNDRMESLDCTFRVSGRQPELWDPVSGAIRQATAFRQAAGRTTLPLEFAPYGSLFVVFRKGITIASDIGADKSNFPRIKAVGMIAGPWMVKFDAKWGGPPAGDVPNAGRLDEPARIGYQVLFRYGDLS